MYFDSEIFFAVLRDVIRVERGDAQTNRDLQETRRHHPTSASLPFRRGVTNFPSTLNFSNDPFYLNIRVQVVVLIDIIDSTNNK